MEQCQQARHGKATAGLLFPRLAELLLQHGRIGHGTPRAIDEKGAMPMPAPVLQGCRPDRLAHAFHEVCQHP
jgi:hypothetical protein